MSDDDRTQERRDVATSRPPESPPTPRSSPRERPLSPTPPTSRVAGEGERWRQAMPTLENRLREFGYDIEPAKAGQRSSAIVARRDLEDRAVVIAIDASGRFRVTITWVVGEWPSQDEFGGVPVRVVDAVSRAVTVTGQMDGPEQIAEVVASLRTIAPWASVA